MSSPKQHAFDDIALTVTIQFVERKDDIPDI